MNKKPTSKEESKSNSRSKLSEYNEDDLKSKKSGLSKNSDDDEEEEDEEDVELAIKSSDLIVLYNLTIPVQTGVKFKALA